MSTEYTCTYLRLKGVRKDPKCPIHGVTLRDVERMVAALQRDQKYGPYRMIMPFGVLREANPAIAAEIEAAMVLDPELKFEILLDEHGIPTSWKQLPKEP